MYVIYKNGKRICMQSGGEKFGGCDGALREYIKFFVNFPKVNEYTISNKTFCFKM